MRCQRCVQGPKLEQTGWCEPHAEWVCPVCKEEFYKLNGKPTKERPFKWPAKTQTNVMGNSGGR